MKDGVTVRAGETIVITASSILGKPPPTAVWSKGGREFKTSDIVQITSTPTSSTLSIKYASRKNTGEYTITASNPFGIKEEKVKVKILDVPGPPGPIEASSVSAEKCTLTWLPPEEDGGCTIKSYTLEKRETSRLLWTKLAEDVMDFRALNSEGLGEPSEVEQVVELVDREEAPEFELDAELRRTLVVKSGASIRIFVPIKGRPTPEVTWHKEDVPLKGRAHIDTTESYTLVVIPECTRYDAGKYVLTLENVAGKKSGFVNVRVVDTPGPPVNLKPSEITKHSITLQWEIPIIDGGSKITNYIIEKRDATRKAYSTVTANWQKCSYKIPDLEEGAEYYFKVSAENERGIGEPAETPEPIKASQAPSAPDNLIVSDVSKDTATLAWTKPKYDGGSRITGYVIEAQLKDSDQWTHVTTIKALDYTATELVENAEYVFRIFAVNSSGRSEPRESRPVVIKEQITAPGFDLRGIYQKTVVAKAGDNLKVDIPVLGRPKPLVVWKKEDQELKQTQRINVENTATSTILNINEIKRKDGGQYSMTGKNILGTVTEIITVQVHDIPGPPTGPIKLDEDSMTISWNEPSSDGGSPILGYHIERKEKNSILWQRISKALVVGNMFKSPGLIDGIAYEFRVIAENLAGLSKASKPSEMTYALDPVDPPGQPVALNITRHEVTLQWSKPEGDGGFSITGYTVEKRELPNGRWLKANFSNIHETNFTVSGLTEDASYEFRVLARNSAGAVSKPSKPSEVIICRDDIEEPKIDADASFSSAVVVKAGDVFKLDARVTGRPIPSLVWTKDGKELEDTGKLEIRTSDFYTCLINKDSLRRDGGAYALTAIETTEAIKISERPLPPGKVSLKEVTGNSVTLSWEKPDHDGGSRITGYIVEMQGKNSEKWTQVMTVKVTEAVVVGLTQGEEYSFRISATNEKGTSDPRPLSVPVVAMDVVIAPAFKLLFSTFSVLAGDDLKIDVPYVAQPKATVTWQKDGIALKETTRVNSEVAERHLYLVIKEATRDDVGKYTIKLTNLAGEATADINVIVLDKPGPPTGPIKIEEVTADSS
uniref:Titin n=1 Tax=Cyprinus carpio TaxID=7962 RepID=A0A8C1MWQ7_CYPCA